MTTSPPADVSSRSAQAVAMIELFASIGATHFDITHTHLSGEKRGFRGNRPLAEVLESMAPLVASADRRQNNVIVRPRVQGTACIQLDDLDAEKLNMIAPAAFLILLTSPGNYQAWVAIQGAPLGTTARLRKGTGADLNASGATRVAGSQNFKQKYEPHFPIVTAEIQRPGHTVTVDELETMGVLAPAPAPIETIHPGASIRRDGKTARSWPSYQRVLEGAQAGPSGHPQRTAADFMFCKIATSWGHSIEDTAARLMQESTKAQENGANYARQTAERAAWAAARRNRGMQP